MDRIDCLVSGAGVVGLAVARALAMAGHSVVVLDPADVIGSGASSRNSEVVHAGLYYTPGSLKASLCTGGRELLLGYCAAHGIPWRRIGKLVVAAGEADRPALEAIEARALACGVTSLQRLTGSEARALEPALTCHAALWSPETAIVDTHALMAALRRDAELGGAAIVLRTALSSAQRIGDAWRVTTTEADGFRIDARWIINCAGLDAQAVARRLDGFPGTHIPPLHVAKGNYFALDGAVPFAHLVYPVPFDGGLGIHLTLDMAGQARFGPDVEWLPDGAPRTLTVDPARATAFTREVQRYWPGLPDDALRPAYAGFRAKLSARGAPAADFRIDGPRSHGVRGVVHCFGIESPGLTASLAIGAHVTALVQSAGH
ncbi:MAG: NAD(P)/FAD-dependent oxidoreductase [Gemmatimonadaceae bacterium]|nr:NAD(P)/FAD-dependent oxidoreductase [Gemmatimonadaceae bacterium]